MIYLKTVITIYKLTTFDFWHYGQIIRLLKFVLLQSYWDLCMCSKLCSIGSKQSYQDLCMCSKLSIIGSKQSYWDLCMYSWQDLRPYFSRSSSVSTWKFYLPLRLWAISSLLHIFINAQVSEVSTLCTGSLLWALQEW